MYGTFTVASWPRLDNLVFSLSYSPSQRFVLIVWRLRGRNAK
jgi:hypothetical protein